MVVAGTCWEYGRASGAVAEARAPANTGVFAATKTALLTVLDSVARCSMFEYRWARIFFVYGPGQRSSSLVPSLRAFCKAGRKADTRTPGALQDFVHVEDVAAALVALAETTAPSGVFNVGSGRPTSVAHVANITSEHYGMPPPYERVPDGEGFWADTRKIYASTGWRANIGIDEGISRTLAALDDGA
jgi:dTDP-6-deoxy-L-talose 4-dehydrogenase (NAD+)